MGPESSQILNKRAANNKCNPLLEIEAVSDFKTCPEESKNDGKFPLQLIHAASDASTSESFLPQKVAAVDEINLVKIEGK